MLYEMVYMWWQSNDVQFDLHCLLDNLQRHVGLITVYNQQMAIRWWDPTLLSKAFMKCEIQCENNIAVIHAFHFMATLALPSQCAM